MGSMNYLRTHKLRVHYNDGKMYPCDICGKIFKSPRYLKVHKKNSHVRQYSEQCDMCPYKFKSVPQLNKHKKLDHFISECHSCTICNENFQSIRNYKEHTKRNCKKQVKEEDFKEEPENNDCDYKQFKINIKVKVEVL